MGSLVDKAKAHTVRRVASAMPTAGELELVLAWINGEVSTVQVAHVIEGGGVNKTSTARSKILTWLALAAQEGLIRAELTEKGKS